MPVINIQQIAGRSREQKNEVMRRITEAFVEVYQVPAEGVMIMFQDLHDEDWGRNGCLHADREQ